MLPAKSSFQPVLLDRLRSWKGEQQLLRVLRVDDLTNSRSGIGASKVLRMCDIEQIVDLPGVGEKLKGVSKFVKWTDYLLMREQIITSISFNIMLQTMRTLWTPSSGEGRKGPSVRCLESLGCSMSDLGVNSVCRTVGRDRTRPHAA